MGENLWNESSSPLPSSSSHSICPIYRENSIKSFQRAAELHVDFVEFDVQVCSSSSSLHAWPSSSIPPQVTKDGTPVIWHDDSVLTSSGDHQVTSTDISALTLSEFSSIIDQEPTSTRGQLVRQFRGLVSRSLLPGPPLPWTCPNDGGLPLPTFSQLFTSLPTSCGMDVEIKLSNGPEVTRTPPEEVERIVDAIWKVTSEEVEREKTLGLPPRLLFFSSFDPDVCTAIKGQAKGQHAVWFLSGCGLYEHSDPRRTSIASALEFASQNEMVGIVMPAVVLMKNESIVREAASLGLQVMTYGLENDDRNAVMRQKEIGLAGAIIDNVQGLMHLQ